MVQGLHQRQNQKKNRGGVGGGKSCQPRCALTCLTLHKNPTSHDHVVIQENVWESKSTLQKLDSMAFPSAASPFVIRRFEPAFMSPPVFAALPYSPATIAAVSPVMTAAPVEVPAAPQFVVNPARRYGDTNIRRAVLAVPAAAPVPVAVVPSLMPAAAAGCGTCCGKSYSPLPPTAVQAFWSNLNCGGTCSTCLRNWF